VLYRLLADAVMLAHFGFLLFLAVGGFLAWEWPRVLVAHAAAVAWGALSVVGGVECPLTRWEDRFRRLSGEQGIPAGFIDTYLTGVIYPRESLLTVQSLVAGLVAASWLGLAVRHRRRTHGVSR
jgi:hypothetical protein